MVILACSGPNALAIITKNVEFAVLQAELVGAMLCLSLAASLFGRRRSPLFPVAFFTMLAAHPLWLIDPYRGDCGLALRGSAAAETGLAVAVLFAQILWIAIHAKDARKKPQSPREPSSTI